MVVVTGVGVGGAVCSLRREPLSARRRGRQ